METLWSPRGTPPGGFVAPFTWGGIIGNINQLFYLSWYILWVSRPIHLGRNNWKRKSNQDGVIPGSSYVAPFTWGGIIGNLPPQCGFRGSRGRRSLPRRPIHLGRNNWKLVKPLIVVMVAPDQVAPFTWGGIIGNRSHTSEGRSKMFPCRPIHLGRNNWKRHVTNRPHVSCHENVAPFTWGGIIGNKHIPRYTLTNTGRPIHLGRNNWKR